MFRRHEGKGGRISPVLWWVAYFAAALWAQDLSGGFDFLSPGLLVCLQTGQWWSLIWMTWLVIFVQEGMGDLVFGSSLLFYAGMYLAFLFSRWLLEPRNPFFILFFSLLLSVWHWLVLSGAVRFQEIPVRMPAPWTWVLPQWLFYGVFWGGAFWAYRRWVRRGHI